MGVQTPTAWLRLPAPTHLPHLKHKPRFHPHTTSPSSRSAQAPGTASSVPGEGLCPGDIPVMNALLCCFRCQHFPALFFFHMESTGPQLNLFHAVTLINVPNSGTWGLRSVCVCVCVCVCLCVCVHICGLCNFHFPQLLK